ALVDAVPLAGTSQNLITPVGQEKPFITTDATVSPGYFQLLRIAIVRGRSFVESDLRVGDAAIISESAARRFWRDQDPLGKRFRIERVPVDFNVVGVAKDVHAAD